MMLFIDNYVMIWNMIDNAGEDKEKIDELQYFCEYLQKSKFSLIN